MQHLGSDIPYKRRDAEYHTHNIDCVVSVVYHLACTSALLTSLLVRLNGTRKGLGDESARDVVLLRLAGVASGDGE